MKCKSIVNGLTAKGIITKPILLDLPIPVGYNSTIDEFTISLCYNFEHY
jgi:hypothetical protein